MNHHNNYIFISIQTNLQSCRQHEYSVATATADGPTIQYTVHDIFIIR